MGFNIAILISGRGSNMLNILKACQSGKLNSNIATVISNNPNSYGLQKVKSMVDTRVIDHKKFKNFYDFEKSLSNYLKKKKVTLICLAGFMKVLSKDFVEEWDKKIINIHPSLLPAFKGLNPHKKAIEMKVKYSGCTVHFVNKDVDAGSIIDQEIVEISKNENESSLQKKILMKEHKLYINVLKKMEKK